MGLLGLGGKSRGKTGPSEEFVVPRGPDGRRLTEQEVRAARSGRVKREKVVKHRSLPSISMLGQMRRVHQGALEDYHGNRYAVWSVGGMDPDNRQSTNGWLLVLNSVDYPFQVLIRQHAPDLTDVRRNLMAVRPEAMKHGLVNEVGNSLLDFLQTMEDSGRVVSRKWYIIASESRVMELSSVLSQSGFDATRLWDYELGLLLQGCMSGMGIGHEQELYQAKEFPKDLELNHRYMAVYDVHKWPRRMSTLFLEQLLRSGDEMDISLWVWPVSQRESHTRLQMQRARFEGARITAEQKGKLVPPEVELAIMDVIRISDEVERGNSRLYRKTMTIAVYGRDRTELREAGERVSGHFRSNLAGVRLLKYRQGKGYAALMPALRRGVGEMALTDTGTMLRLFPFGPKDLDQREGTLLGMDLRSRTPILYDRFSPGAMNAHMVVMARSGAGKSFFTKLMVFREACRGIPIYLIDPEGEYGVITRALGGDVFVPGSPGHGLNPFVVGYTEEGDLAKRISSLGSLVGVMLEGQVNLDLKAKIDRCLIGFYERELVNDNGSRVLGKGGIAAFHRYLESPEAREKGGEELAHLLSPFATGSSRFLMRDDAKELLHNEAPVTSFNLKNLAGPMKAVATSVCSEVVWGLAVTDPKPRLLVVDECWTVLATPSGAEALITIVKRARKYQLGLLTITQDVQDFLAEQSGVGLITGHAGRSLLQNSATKLAFSQDPAALGPVIEALGLADDVGQFLAGALRGQGVLVGESGDVYPVEVVSTQLERDLVTDASWRQDGDNLPKVELDETGRGVELADRLELLLERERVEEASVGV